MKECLNCNKSFDEKRDSAKYCSGNCRVKWNRKNPKKEKKLSELQQIKVMYNILIKKIDDLALHTVSLPLDKFKQNFSDVVPQIEINPKIAIKKTSAHWVELRRECQDANDFAKWIEDLENDQFLTIREKSQIKQTV